MKEYSKQDVPFFVRLLADVSGGRIIKDEKLRGDFQHRTVLELPVLESKRVGFVYLMKNERGFTKIGYTTKSPEFREKTLQSDNPNVELLFSISLSNAKRIEGFLHEEFSNYRIRGEWFDLSQDDINSCIKYLKNLQ